MKTDRRTPTPRFASEGCSPRLREATELRAFLVQPPGCSLRESGGGGARSARDVSGRKRHSDRASLNPMKLNRRSGCSRKR